MHPLFLDILFLCFGIYFLSLYSVSLINILKEICNSLLAQIYQNFRCCIYFVNKYSRTKSKYIVLCQLLRRKLTLSQTKREHSIKITKHNALWQSSLFTRPARHWVFLSPVCGSLHKLVSWHAGSDTRGPVFIILVRFWTFQADFRALN